MHNEEQSGRIARYETMFDAVSQAAGQLSDALDRWESVRAQLCALEAYYGSELWKRDFADDEAGLLSATLKRGVLSEDGVYDLLEAVGQLRSRLAAAAEEEKGD